MPDTRIFSPGLLPTKGEQMEQLGDRESERCAAGVSCRQCGATVEREREHYATPVCFACLPPPPPIPVRRKCGNCIHDAHSGMCTGRNGGTAYPCPCHHSSGGMST